MGRLCPPQGNKKGVPGSNKNGSTTKSPRFHNTCTLTVANTNEVNAGASSSIGQQKKFKVKKVPSKTN